MLECFEFSHIAIVVYIHKINSTCEYAEHYGNYGTKYFNLFLNMVI